MKFLNHGWSCLCCIIASHCYPEYFCTIINSLRHWSGTDVENLESFDKSVTWPDCVTGIMFSLHHWPDTNCLLNPLTSLLQSMKRVRTSQKELTHLVPSSTAIPISINSPWTVPSISFKFARNIHWRCFRTSKREKVRRNAELCC